MSTMPPPPGPPPQEPSQSSQNIAAAITEVSERASVLVREEIELAKAELSEKVAKLVRGAIVGAAAGVFVLMALIFALVGVAWLLYFYLPVATYAYFFGFFALAVILLAFGALAGLIAARAVKRATPPVPNMAIEEARKIRETVSGDGASPPARPSTIAAAQARVAPVEGGEGEDA